MKRQRRSCVIETPREGLLGKLGIKKSGRPRRRTISHIDMCEDTSEEVNVMDDILGREEQKQIISKFVDQAKTNRDFRGNLYISGLPGTGKTASVKAKLSLTPELQCVYLNCMNLKENLLKLYEIIKNRIAFTSIRQSTRRSMSSKSSQQSNNVLDNVFASRTSVNTKIVLVFDEIDQLANQIEHLVPFFSFQMQEKHNYCVIGISNGLDFSHKIEQCAESYRIHLEMERLVFPPYKPSELEKILKAKVSKEIADLSHFDSAAIKFCSQKIASVTGDLRKALSVLKSAYFSKEKRSTAKITVMDVKRVMDLIYHPVQINTNVNENKEIESQLSINNSSGSLLTLHQNLILLSIMNLSRKHSVKIGDFELSSTLLYKEYTVICKNHRFDAVSEGEIFHLCSSLQDQRILTISTPSARSTNKLKNLPHIKLQLSEKEILSILLANPVTSGYF